MSNLSPEVMAVLRQWVNTAAVGLQEKGSFAELRMQCESLHKFAGEAHALLESQAAHITQLQQQLSLAHDANGQLEARIKELHELGQAASNRADDAERARDEAIRERDANAQRYADELNNRAQSETGDCKRCGKSRDAKKRNGCHTIGCTFADESAPPPQPETEAAREPRPGEIDEYMRTEHAKALQEQTAPPQPETGACPECSQYNVRYSVVMKDLQNLASKVSGGDCSNSHGLDCTTIIAHHWDKLKASPPPQPETASVQFDAKEISDLLDKLSDAATRLSGSSYYDFAIAAQRACQYIEATRHAPRSTAHPPKAHAVVKDSFTTQAPLNGLAGWSVDFTDTGKRSALLIRGPEGQGAAIEIPADSIRAEIASQFAYAYNNPPISFSAQPSQAQLEPPSQDLRDYGYAPGGYWSNCIDCNADMTDVDKRCRCCKPCAEKKRDAALKAHESSVVKESLTNLCAVKGCNELAAFGGVCASHAMQRKHVPVPDAYCTCPESYPQHMGHHPDCNSQRADVEPVAPPNDDARDAARYRWLRQGNDYEKCAPMIVLCEREHIESDDRPMWVIGNDVLDNEVDKAMRGESRAHEPGEGQ